MCCTIYSFLYIPSCVSASCNCKEGTNATVGWLCSVQFYILVLMYWCLCLVLMLFHSWSRLYKSWVDLSWFCKSWFHKVDLVKVDPAGVDLVGVDLAKVDLARYRENRVAGLSRNVQVRELQRCYHQEYSWLPKVDCSDTLQPVREALSFLQRWTWFLQWCTWDGS